MSRRRRAVFLSVLAAQIVPGCALRAPAADISAACGGRPRVSRDSGIVVGDAARRINAFVERLALLRVFSGQVLVARHDSVLLYRGYGLADRDQCIPVTTETGFDIASLSKQFTAAALLALVEDGRVSLSDTIGRWLANVPRDKRAITLEQLANHTSGIPRELDEVDSDHFGLDLQPPRDSVVREILARPSRFDPGTKFEYSNMGYVLLAATLENAAGRPFQELVRSTLIRPAGLARTGFQSDSRRRPRHLIARAYADLYDDGAPYERPDSWRGIGGSQIVTTAGDLLDWHRALRSGRVLGADSREAVMVKGGPSYALGWSVVRRADGTAGVIFHAGGHPRSFGSEFRYYPARDLVVIVLSNWRHDDVRMQEDVVANVGDHLVGRDSALVPLPDVVESAPRSPFVGRYELSAGDTLIVWQNDAAELWAAPIGQGAFDVLYGRDSTDSRRSAAESGVTTLIDSLSRQRCPAPRGLDPAVRTHELRAPYLVARWCELRRHGEVTQVRVVGVGRRSYSTTRSLAVTQVRFGRTDRTIAWEMNGSEFIKAWSASDVPFPQSRALASLRSGGLVAYDWFRSRQVTISGDAATPMNVLRIQTPEGSLSARRVP